MTYTTSTGKVYKSKPGPKTSKSKQTGGKKKKVTKIYRDHDDDGYGTMTVKRKRKQRGGEKKDDINKRIAEASNKEEKERLYREQLQRELNEEALRKQYERDEKARLTREMNDIKNGKKVEQEELRRAKEYSKQIKEQLTAKQQEEKLLKQRENRLKQAHLRREEEDKRTRREEKKVIKAEERAYKEDYRRSEANFGLLKLAHKIRPATHFRNILRSSGKDKTLLGKVADKVLTFGTQLGFGPGNQLVEYRPITLRKIKL